MQRIEDTALRVMEELWLDQYPAQGIKMGFTANQLAGKIGLSVVAINDALNGLRQRNPPVIISETIHTGGKPAQVFMLDIEQVITWPATANLVLHLFECVGGNCSRQALKQYMLSKAFIDPETKKPFKPPRVQKQIEFAVTRKYLGCVPRHRDLLSISARARDERAYLEFIGRDGKTPSK